MENKQYANLSVLKNGKTKGSELPEQAHVRLNNVSLLGAIMKQPVVFKNEEGEPISAIVRVTTTRGVRDISKGRKDDSSPVFDDPPVVTDNPDVLREIDTWEIGDIVSVKGVIASKNVNKASYCDFCGARQESGGVLTYVYPIHAMKIEHIDNPDERLRYLVRHREMSNTFFCFGTLLRDPKLRIPAKGIHFIHFPIGMNRKFFIATDPPELKSDYPWVKVYNEMADYNLYKLQIASVIYIDGFLQTRSVLRKKECSACGKVYSWRERALEIVPYQSGIEYISGYRTENEVGAMREKSEREVWESAGLRWVSINAQGHVSEEPNPQDAEGE